MAKISTGYTFGLDPRQATACRLIAEGEDEKEILAVIFNLGPEADAAEKKKALNTLRKWMRMQEFKDCYRAIVNEIAMPSYSKALKKIASQIDDSQGWLANKAANDILTRFGPAVMGDDDKQVVIKVDGGPVIGVPEE